MRQFFRRHSAAKPFCISFIVVAYDMGREIPRTLQSLQAQYQHGSDHINYEVIVVDNGSPEPLDAANIQAFGSQFRLLRIDDASPSPVPAINMAAKQARGSHIAVVIDGARILSPGILHWSKQAFHLSQRAVVSVLGFHLGPAHQRLASEHGYHQALEDRLLASINWPHDGYRLFDIASLAGSSKYGWVAPLAESNCIVVPRTLYEEVGGYDEGFCSAGGGLANLDFYKRCCDAKDITLYHLFGEGCFHQIHGGVTTGGGAQMATRYHELTQEYAALRGEPHQPPQNTPVLLGEAQPGCLRLLSRGTRDYATLRQVDEAFAQVMQQAGITLPPID
ncbi:MAG: hypothetical protein CSA53_00315 [Gammaproteobacteria bacterium]|nr:MAG: hypothetical protein CSA53_00315 [Gammaproteobacteria bacterium]